MVHRLALLPLRLRRAVAVLGAFAAHVFITAEVSAISVIAPEFEELVHASGSIARARVLSVEPFATVSRDGTPIVKTRVTWKLLETLKGETAPTFSLDFLGGRVGAEELRISGMPVFVPGEEDFLFVEADTRVICPLYAVGHGRYRILVEPRSGRPYVARENNAPLLDVSQVSLPMTGALPAPLAARAIEALSPEAFAARVRETLERKEAADVR
ncbi:hypothetical protein ASA1KI_11650 [Opitutales bacterium ASA1]|uniref:hypothetical protein n=1 Tax=Congregicoccus parvus TaxID=3081749 RepID=UPI002B2875E0|nr:hypothetical protein ASA1KI_11650 [Opitutales bacterium ASA1]